MSAEAVHLSPLHALHQRLGARFTRFADYQLPLNYPGGILQEHRHTRSRAGLFDISHMGQIEVAGTDLPLKLEQLLPADLCALDEGSLIYTVLSNDRGGIIDDLILNRCSEERFLLIVNSARLQEVLKWLHSRLHSSIQIRHLDRRALLALQGPVAAERLRQVIPELRELSFMSGCEAEILGATCYVMRCGYTGEDGFEISLPVEAALGSAEYLLQMEDVQAVGLGARDSLRLEAGFCLYGAEIHSEITPVEAGLGWLVSPARRVNGARPGGFPGADRILAQLQKSMDRKRIGLHCKNKVVLRRGTSLQDADDNTVGEISSGGFSPSLGISIAIAYVNAAVARPGNSLWSRVRDIRREAVLCSLPFVPHRRNIHA